MCQLRPKRACVASMRSRTLVVVRRWKRSTRAPHLVDCELAVIDRSPVVERAPDERLAEARLAARHVLVGPAAAIDEREIDVAGVAVEVDVGARRERGDQADAALGRRQIELVDEAVLAFAQVELAQARAEVGREVEARMRRVEDERDARRGGAMSDEGGGRTGDCMATQHSPRRRASKVSRTVG